MSICGGISLPKPSSFNRTNISSLEPDYTKAIELKPNDADDWHPAYFNRGVAKQDKGDLDGAIADYIKLIELKPNDADAYYNRGYAKQAKGDLDGAIADCNKAIELKPDLAERDQKSIVARSGKVYRNIEILGIEPDAISIKSSMSNQIEYCVISLADLSTNFQQRFGYDPQKALQYKNQKAQLAANYQAYQAELQKLQAKQNREAALQAAERGYQVAEQNYEAAKAKYDDFLKKQQTDALRRAVAAQERQADALEQQNFQQQWQGIEQNSMQRELLWKLNQIDWDLQK
jgi:tetratricopeptide (TPR) repeat protein